MGLANKVKIVSKLIYKRPRGWKSLLYNSYMHQNKKSGPLMPPVHISIEPTNVCNARCPVCETGKKQMERKAGFLNMDSYKKFIDDVAPTTNSIMYYFMGEPFLKAESYEQIKYARSKGIYVDSCTNGDFVDAEAIIYSDINKISFQIGGLDNSTHQIYRVRSELPRVIKNIEELVRLKKKHPSSNVEIDVGFIVMKHNEEQVNDFIKWAESLGVDTANIIDPCVRNMEEGDKFLTKDKKYWYYDEEAYREGVLKPKIESKNECIWIWNSIQLNWNGDAVPCCRDPNGKNILGNVFDEGLMPVFNGKNAINFRKKILSNQKEVGICELCSGYGLPDLNKTRKGSFTIKRHTVRDIEIDY